MANLTPAAGGSPPRFRSPADDTLAQVVQLHDALVRHHRQARAIETALLSLRGQQGVENWLAHDLNRIEGMAAQLRHELEPTIGQAGYVADALDR